MGRFLSQFLVLLSLASVSCSLSRFALTECEVNAECRNAFGWGHVCVDALCAPVNAFSRCSETHPSDLLQRPDKYQDLYVIGIQFNQESWAPISNAAEFALSELQGQTGLGENHFGYVVCDTSASSRYDNLSQEEANTAVSEYLADNVGAVAIIGPATSDAAERTFKQVQRHGTLVMSPSATGIPLTIMDGSESSYLDPGLFWRTCASDALQSQKMVDLMHQDGINNAAVIYEKTNYGTPFAGQIKADAQEQYGITVTLFPYDSSSLNALDSQITRVEGNDDPDNFQATHDVDAVVFLSGNQEHIVHFLETVERRSTQDSSHTCSDLSICPFREDGAQLYLADGAKDPKIFNDMENIVHRIKGTYPAEGEGLVYEAFSETFDAEYGNGSSDFVYVEHSYDAAWLIAYGAAWAYYNEAEISGLGIARGLRQVSKKGTGEVINIGPGSWGTVRAKFAAQPAIDVQGASGELDYDPTTGETTTEIKVWCVGIDESSAFIEGCVD